MLHFFIYIKMWRVCPCWCGCRSAEHNLPGDVKGSGVATSSNKMCLSVGSGIPLHPPHGLRQISMLNPEQAASRKPKPLGGSQHQQSRRSPFALLFCSPFVFIITAVAVIAWLSPEVLCWGTSSMPSISATCSSSPLFSRNCLKISYYLTQKRLCLLILVLWLLKLTYRLKLDIFWMPMSDLLFQVHFNFTPLFVIFFFFCLYMSVLLV